MDNGAVSTPEQLLDEGMAAAQRSELTVAAQRFEAAARGFLAAGNRGSAQVALSNLAQMRKQAGDYRSALAAADEAVALFTPETPDRERAYVLFNRAGVLDRLGDPAAFEAWTATVKAMGDQRGMMAVSLAHAAGARLLTYREEGLHNARVAISLLGEHATLAHVIGLIGAVGDSAPGAAGIPFLAQAVWLMQQHPETCNRSNAPFLDMLAERIGLDHPIAVLVCLLGLMLANARKGTEDHPAVMWWASRMVKRCSAARSLTIEVMLGELNARARELSELAPALERMVGRDWLVPRGPGPALA